MAYSELIKSFDRIRDYMRQFYIYGFKSRTEYDKKSARSYDNERRRIESWLGDFMRFRQTPDGKNLFLSVDSRAISANPLYKAFKARSFTSGDLIFHFYVLDLLQDGQALTAQEILELISRKYLIYFDTCWQPDLSTIRKKLKEYVSLGILTDRKEGREIRYSRSKDSVSLEEWADTVSFFSEANPLGVIGSTILDKFSDAPDHFRFKHHYILHALDSQILLAILDAIGKQQSIKLVNIRTKNNTPGTHTVCPLKVYISTQGGRQYLLCYHYQFQKLMFFRLDNILKVEAGTPEAAFDRYLEIYNHAAPYFWGTSTGTAAIPDHLEMTIHFEDYESHIPQRLEREKRNGKVEQIDRNTCKYITDTYDAMEMLPWLRTFIGRIERLECSNPQLVQRFYEDLERMYSMYGGDE